MCVCVCVCVCVCERESFATCAHSETRKTRQRKREEGERRVRWQEEEKSLTGDSFVQRGIACDEHKHNECAHDRNRDHNLRILAAHLERKWRGGGDGDCCLRLTGGVRATGAAGASPGPLLAASHWREPPRRQGRASRTGLPSRPVWFLLRLVPLRRARWLPKPRRDGHGQVSSMS